MTPDGRARPGDGGDAHGRAGIHATGLDASLAPGHVARRCADWATSSRVSEHLADDLAAGRPLDPADLDRIVFGECEDDR